ncbi:hinge domain of cleavage stimulation factor subunit 2-domain-containing protein [Phaeosphaeria sp. MPI-PUGE-AT-0046c]|nr:hinge domain of cleavage stimulation factor subunit 2-domain-containing protein [Phaeosphaeria sp. MPI-PUGE-AT-0046c]
MAPNDKAGRVVFIGNIPYGGTEELIIETLGRAGQVNNFRLVYDKETGRPKGFGFAEFADADAAASAVRNLDNLEIMGRKLRVDYSNENGSGDNAPSNPPPAQPPMAYPPMNGQAPEPAHAQQSSALPPLPPGADLAPNLTCPDSISRTLSTLPAPQLLDILSQMKGLVMTDPAKATELLRQAPQLAYAIFQSLLLLQLVDPQTLGSLVETATAAPAPVAQPPPMQQQPQHVARPPVNYPGYPPQTSTPQPPAHMPQPYAQPVPPQAQPPPQQQPPSMDQQAMYAQLLALTPDQINALPPDYRAQVLQLRQIIGAGGRP